MISSKQRAKLRSLAQNVDTGLIIGKDGVTDSVLEQIGNLLYAHELVKISVLEGCEFDAKECLSLVCEKLDAIQVCSIGRKFVLYKFSNKKGIKHIEL